MLSNRGPGGIFANADGRCAEGMGNNQEGRRAEAIKGKCCCAILVCIGNAIEEISGENSSIHPTFRFVGVQEVQSHDWWIYEVYAFWRRCYFSRSAGMGPLCI